MKSKNIVVVFLLVLFSSAASQRPIWEQTNGPYGGTILRLAVHSSGDLFAGVYDNGLFRSTNSGDSWFRSGFSGENVRYIFMSSSGHIYAGVDYWYLDQNGNEILRTKLHRSVDDGVTWNLIDIVLNYISCISADNEGNIYIAGHTQNVPSAIGTTIIRSTNQGQTWNEWVFREGYSEVNDLQFWGSNIFLSDDSNGIFRLVNGVWIKVFPSLPGGLGTSCITKTQSNVLLAGTSRWTPQGVYRSTDTAVTWQRIFSGGIENKWINSIVISSDGTVFAGTNQGIFKSTDEGLTWVQVSLSNSNVKTLIIYDNNTLLSGDDFGILRGKGLGAVWEKVNLGLCVDKIRSIAINNLSNILFSSTSIGLFRSTNNGIIWEFLLPWTGTLLFDNDSGILYTRSYYDLYRSSDDGSTWSTSPIPSEFIIYCLQGGLRPGEILGGGLFSSGWSYSAIFASTNYGQSWTYTNLAMGLSLVRCVSVSDYSGNIFAGTEGIGIYRSTNGGANWRLFNIGLTNEVVKSTIINVTGHIFVGTYGGVFRSKDEGGNWKLVGLENDSVSALAINSLGYILAGTISGKVFLSTDDGNTWSDYSSGLNLTEVSSLVIDENDFAMVGTRFYGVFRTKQPTTDIDENDNVLPIAFQVFQNYPNPFNPSTTIRYAIPLLGGARGGSQLIQLKVYDILGNEIETLVNEEKSPGTYEVAWNAVALPSGVYFYQLRATPNGGQAGSFIETKKMVLLR